jgi:hypothetical protein
MVRPNAEHAEHFNALSALYLRQVQQQLSQHDKTDSPISAAFNEWARSIQGIKSLSDIKRDNLLEYQKIVFLCEHNLIFNLMFHNRFDLLRELLSGETSNQKTARNTPRL